MPDVLLAQDLVPALHVALDLQLCLLRPKALLAAISTNGEKTTPQEGGKIAGEGGSVCANSSAPGTTPHCLDVGKYNVGFLFDRKLDGIRQDFKEENTHGITHMRTCERKGRCSEKRGCKRCMCVVLRDQSRVAYMCGIRT